jgi:hypothetical protein
VTGDVRRPGLRGVLARACVMRLGLSTAALIGIAWLPAIGQQPAGDVGEAVAPSKGAVARVWRVVAPVEAIDAATRTISLKTASGTVPVHAGAEFHDFARIRVGDLVVIRYLEALSLELKRSGTGGRERAETRTGDPAAGGARRRTVVADVVAKDSKMRTATLRGPQQTVTVKVSDPEQLRLVMIGERVEATYTEAVAVSIEPALTPKRDAVKQ